MEQLVGFINHFMNLLLPAFWLASLMVLVHRLLFRRQAIAMRWQRQWLWLFASGAAVLLAGLLLQQRDGVAQILNRCGHDVLLSVSMRTVCFAG